MKQCKKYDCDKRAISFSDFCGEHTENELYASVLKDLEPGKYSEVFISEMDIDNLEIKDLHFYDSTIEDCHFEGGTWLNIRLEFSSLKSCLFEKTRISEFRFDEESIWASCTYHDCIFIDLQALVTSLSNGEFRNTKWINTSFDQSLFTQVDFLDSEFISLNITVCGLDTVSFQHCYIKDANISDIKLAVTFCVDTIFENTRFVGELIHDFAQMQDPLELCLFQNCTSKWILEIEDFKVWNGINEDPLSFYWRVLDHITNAVHVNNLSPVQFIVKRVMDIIPDSSQLAERLRDMLSVYFSYIREEQDISGFGQLASLMGRLPQELIINKSQYLPSPKILESRNVLRIDIACNISKLNSLHNVVLKLKRLDLALANCGLDALDVVDFKKGSVTIVVSSTVAAIVGIVVLLYKAGHLFLDTENKILSNKKLKQDLNRSDHDSSLCKYDEQLKKQQVILNDLEIQKRKNELKANHLPDKYIAVTDSEIMEITAQDPFGQLELKPYKEAKEAAKEVLELGETNVYIEVIEKAIDSN